MGTGALFMTVASVLWGKNDQPVLTKQQMLFPIAMYLGNFTFAMILSMAAGIYIPVLLGLLLGVLPALGLWRRTFLAEAEATAQASTMPVVRLIQSPTSTAKTETVRS
jgi:putative membrane protein